jgi:hypothetical protein
MHKYGLVCEALEMDYEDGWKVLDCHPLAARALCLALVTHDSFNSLWPQRVRYAQHRRDG